MKRLMILWIALQIGCAAPTDDQGQTPQPEQEAATAAGEALTLGSRGENVRVLYEYLARYGYFPNPDLAARYPGFEPLVAEPPADPNVYDEHLADAVHRYQANMGLEATGEADAATLALTRQARCEWPDGYGGNPPHQHENADGTIEKFETLGGLRRNWTWSIESWPSSTTESTVINLTQQMIDEWKRVYPTALTRVARGQGELKISFGDIDGPTLPAALQPDRTCSTAVPNNGCVLGVAGNNQITLDRTEKWEFTGTTTYPENDYRGIVLHELGHRLGMYHSDRPAAVMYANSVRGETKRVTTADDHLAVRSTYALWQQIVTPAPATDVGAADRVYWISNEPTGGGFKIYRWISGSTHEALDGGAVRVAVDGRGRAWVVNNGGSIYHRAENNSAWRQVPGPCARDIAVIYGGQVVIAGCDGKAYVGNMNPNQPDSGLDPQRNSGFSLASPTNGWPQPNLMNVGSFGNVAAVFSDYDGVVWVLSAFTFQPYGVAEPIVTSDVAGSRDGESLWAVRRVSGIYALNVQSARINTNATSRWQGYPSAPARRVAVAANGRPFYVNEVGTLMTTTK